MPSCSLTVCVSLSRLSGRLTGAHFSDFVVVERSHGAPTRSAGFVLFTGDSRVFSSARTTSPYYLCSNALHPKPSPSPSSAPPSSLGFGSMRYCVCGIPPSSKISSSLHSATVIPPPNTASSVNLRWDSGELYMVSPDRSDERTQPPYDVPLLSPFCSSTGDLPKLCVRAVKRDIMVNTCSWVWPIKSCDIRLDGLVRDFLDCWVWPIKFMESVNFSNSLPNSIPLKTSMQLIIVDWVCVNSFEISDGFIGVFTLHLLSYLSCLKNFSVDSLWLPSVSASPSVEENTLQPCLLSMIGDVLSGLFPSVTFSLFTVLLSCVAVRTGPEDASEIISIIFVGESWTSTSYHMTISQLSDYVVKAHMTHLSSVSNSLSTSKEDLSVLCLSGIVVYAFPKRGCNIPSCYVLKQE